MIIKTHIAFGLFAGLLSLYLIDVPNKLLFLAIVCFASILPDIDSTETFIGRRLRFVSFSLNKAFGHRGFVHSLFPLFGIYLLFFYFFELSFIGLPLIIGYMSHLLLDTLNHSGIGYFHPLYKKRIKGFLRTRGVFDYTLLFILLLADAFFIFKELFIV